MIRPLRWLARLVLVASLLFLIVAIHPTFSGINPLVAEGEDGSIVNRSDLPFGLDTLKGVFPIGPVLSAAAYYVGERNSMVLRDRLKDWSFSAQAPAAVGGKEIYVLIIGESSRADRWQLNGYARATNPMLSVEPNVVALRNAISPWSFTVGSVPVIMSRKPGTDGSRLLREKSLVSLFREAGFRTYWLSNQAQSTGASAIAQISSEADESFWMNISANDVFGESSQDEILLTPMREMLSRNEQRQFIVLHLMGSHDAYYRRYPTSFNVFVPSTTDSPRLNDKDPRNREFVINAYDNSILYTDFVIHSVIGMLAGSGALSGLIYTSDHGESVFDGTCSRLGHGGTARQNYPVSALAWLSDRYLAAFPEVGSVLRGNAARPITTENTFESMADLAHISYPGADRSRSIFSATFSERHRIVNVGEKLIDWDKARFVGACEDPVPPG